MARYTLNHRPRRKKLKFVIQHLRDQSICKCPERTDGEHECPAVEFREMVENRKKMREMSEPFYRAVPRC